jgi:hypothetical protein
MSINKIIHLFQALTNLAKNSNNAQQMGDNGIVAMVLQCMFCQRESINDDDFTGLKITGAKLLTSLAKENDENREEIRNARGLKDILSLIKTSSDIELKIVSLELLRVFCSNALNRSLTPQLNGHLIIIAELNRSQNEQVVSTAVQALDALVLDNESNAKLVAEHVKIEPILACLHTCTVQALRLLRIISLYNVTICCKIIMSKNHIRPFIAMSTIDSLQILNNMFQHDRQACRQVLIENQCLEKLVDDMYSNKNPRLLELLIRIMTNIEPSYLGGSDRIIPYMTSLIESNTNDGPLVKACLDMIGAITKSLEDHTSTVVANLLSQPDQQVQYAALCALENGIDTGLIEKVATHVKLHVICNWLQNVNNDKLATLLMRSLHYMLTHERADAQQVANMMIVGSLIQRLSSSTNATLLSLLQVLTASDEFVTSFINMGGMEPLIKSLPQPWSLSSADPLVINPLSDTLYSLTLSNRQAQLLAGEFGMLQLLFLSMNKMERSDPLLSKYMAILKNCCQHEVNVLFLMSLDIIDSLLLPLCKVSLSIRVVEDICEMLVNMTCQIDAASSIIAPHVNTFIPLLVSENWVIQESVLCLISNLSPHLVQTDEIQESLQQLSNNDDDNYLSALAKQTLEHVKDKTGQQQLQRHQPNIDYDKKKMAISQAYLKQSVGSDLSISIDWSFYDSLFDKNEKRRALSSLRTSTWSNMKNSITKFCDQSPIHANVFKSNVDALMISVDRHSKLSIMEHTLHYKVGYDDFEALPIDQFVHALNEALKPSISQHQIQENYNNPQKMRETKSNRSQNMQHLKQLADECSKGHSELMTMTKFMREQPFHQHDDMDILAIDRIVQLLKVSSIL